MLSSLTKYPAEVSLPNKRYGIFTATVIAAVLAFLLPTSKYLPDIFLIASLAITSAVIIIWSKAKKTKDINGFAGLVLINLLTALCFSVSVTKLMIKSQEIGAFMVFFDIDVIKNNLFLALLVAGIIIGIGLYIINKASVKIKLAVGNMLCSKHNNFDVAEIKFLSSINEVNKVMLFLYITGIFIFIINVINSTAKGIIISTEMNVSAKTYLCCSIAIVLIVEAQLIILMLCGLGVIGKIFDSSHFITSEEPDEEVDEATASSESKKGVFEQILAEKKDLIFEEASWVDANETK